LAILSRASELYVEPPVGAEEVLTISAGPFPNSPSLKEALMWPTIQKRSMVMGALLLTALWGCATLQQIAALRNVDFDLQGVSDVRLAGIDVQRVRSFSDLGFSEAAGLTLAVTRGELPLDLRLHIVAENPARNTVDARMVRMDWTLLLQDRETLSGVLEEEVVLQPGQPTVIPLTVSVNLVEFFEGSAQDLLELALSLAGAGGASKDVALRATPTINTPLGPMRYPSPITILNTQVGG
jgi:hypothetical protein